MINRTNTREKILKTAANLFWQRSYHSTSVDIICREAKIQKGSFYHFFESKEVLLVTIIDDLWQQHVSHFIHPTFDQSIAPLERFNRLISMLGDTACKIKKEHGTFYGCPFGNLASELSTQNERIRKPLNRVFNEYTDIFKSSLDDAIAVGDLPQETNSLATAQLLISCLQGSYLLAKTTNKPEILKKHFKQLFKAIIAGTHSTPQTIAA